MTARGNNMAVGPNHSSCATYSQKKLFHHIFGGGRSQYFSIFKTKRKKNLSKEDAFGKGPLAQENKNKNSDTVT